MAAGADLKRVHPLTSVTFGDGRKRPFQITEDVDLLERAVEKWKAALVVIDPPSAFLPQERNANDDKDVRGALAPLAQMGERTGATVWDVRHLNKANGLSAIHRGNASVAWTAAARSSMVVGNHPEQEGVHVLALNKSNLAGTGRARTYTIATREVEVVGKTGKLVNAQYPVIVWGETADLTADEVITDPDHTKSRGKKERPQTKQDLAGGYLERLLANGPENSEIIKRHTLAMDISLETLNLAKKKKGVTSRRRRRGPNPGSYWHLPQAKTSAP
jgi:hypothetical protein